MDEKFIKGGPEPSSIEDLCLVNVSVKYFSKLCFGTSKMQLNWNIWKPFLKSSPFDFSGQRPRNTSLVVFLRFHSFSLVVKWPEFEWCIWPRECKHSSMDRSGFSYRKDVGSNPWSMWGHTLFLSESKFLQHPYKTCEPCIILKKIVNVFCL